MLQLAMAGLQVGMSLLKERARKKQAQAANMVAEAQAAASNMARDSRNLQEGTQATLTRFAQSVNNQRLLDTAADSRAAAERTIARARDARSINTLSGRMAAAEMAGEIAASTAFNGVTGGAGNMIAATSALRAAISEEAARRHGAEQEFELVEQASAFTKNAILGMDRHVVADNIDFGEDVASHQNEKMDYFGAIMNSGAVQTGLNAWINSGPSKDLSFDPDKATPV